MNHLNQPYREDKRVAKEINLKDLYRVLKKRFWIVMVITIVTTAAGWVYSNLNQTIPLYETSTNIIIDADSEYRKTLQVIIKDTTVLENVIEQLGLDKSPEALAGQINVTNVDESQVVKISVIDTDPNRAVEIANSTAKVFTRNIPKIIVYKDIRILSEATLQPFPINESNPNKYILIAFIFGIIVGTGLIFLIDSLDDSIKSERDIEMMLGIQVLGSVSKMNKKNINKRKKKRAELELRGETIGIK
ncbi:YveK family protein [Lederbergia citrea]|uniref:YveK family protein n=1 Tax=Lederbergia citrea TaxID=2833581 RepID=UPI001BC90D9E|nr:Wzz/FepE/Etk N-terminal domain-containing protein [Lederbergia citrea]MBS4179160.1 capsular biosynthesis protein [Lederbergia citrea]